jgi:hypothetical protein
MPRPENANGCYDRPPLQRYALVQDGWIVDGQATATVMDAGFAGEVHLRHAKWIPTPWVDKCMYDNKGTDPRCSGCKHQKE